MDIHAERPEGEEMAALTVDEVQVGRLHAASRADCCRHSGAG